MTALWAYCVSLCRFRYHLPCLHSLWTVSISAITHLAEFVGRDSPVACWLCTCGGEEGMGSYNLPPPALSGCFPAHTWRPYHHQPLHGYEPPLQEMGDGGAVLWPAITASSVVCLRTNLPTTAMIGVRARTCPRVGLVVIGAPLLQMAPPGMGILEDHQTALLLVEILGAAAGVQTCLWGWHGSCNNVWTPLLWWQHVYCVSCCFVRFAFDVGETVANFRIESGTG